MTIWTFVDGNGQIVVLGGALALGLAVFLGGYRALRRRSSTTISAVPLGSQVRVVKTHTRLPPGRNGCSYSTRSGRPVRASNSSTCVDR
jgi:hypothetical protein